ncbi:MAG: hypothetical protein C7B45_14780 [Sulfobacillus acidophilus]|uniref:Uncharacterized protein n=1 Tax=Sulfobacillus acidophilus TaxID=53633 RepID=A0A2T2WE29_9FIRM|nr:MAG: hypothetical protein C7B45_14780 [Sulfobacillus acidophilus]
MSKHSVEQGGVENQIVGVGGIDAAKDWHYVQWLDMSGTPVAKAFRFANTRAGFEAMWDRRPSDAVRIDWYGVNESLLARVGSARKARRWLTGRLSLADGGWSSGRRKAAAEILTRAEVLRLFATAEADPRALAVPSLLLATGLRLDVLAQACWQKARLSEDQHPVLAISGPRVRYVKLISSVWAYHAGRVRAKPRTPWGPRRAKVSVGIWWPLRLLVTPAPM